MSSSDGETLSLFSGLGGLDFGARLAGLSIIRSTDQDGEALRLLHAALKTPTVTADVTHGGAKAVLERLDLPSPEAIQYVIGGPPCTAFSHAGFWLEGKRNGEDPAGRLLDDFIDFVRIIQPRAFVMENVPGLAFRTHSRYFHRLIARARRAGYAVSWEVLKASEFGVAQARRRLFVVGVLGGPRFVFSTHGSAMRAAGWAIGELEDRDDLAEHDEQPGGQWGALLPRVPAGGNYLHFTREKGCDEPLFKYRGRYWSFLLKAAPNEPAPTIPAQRVTFNGPFHWKNRHLRVREMARLQGFPDWYPISHDLSTARRHIGNAVPPPLAAAMIWSVRRHLGDAAEDQRPQVLDVLNDPTASFETVQSSMARP